MAKTNAQRQAEYRARHLKDVDGDLVRLNLLIRVSSKRQLERLAAYDHVTQTYMLEQLLHAAETDLLDQLTPEQQDNYFGQAPRETYHPTEEEKTRLMEAYSRKFGGIPATELWCGFETDRYWYKIKRTVETGEPFRDDPGIPGAVL